MGGEHDKKKWPLWVKLLLAVSPLFILLVAGLIWDAIAFASFKTARSALTQAGILYTFEDLDAARKEWPEDENAALFLIELSKDENWNPPLTTEQKERLPIVGQAEGPDLGYRWHDETVAAVEAYLGDQVEVLEQLDKLRDYEGGRMPVDPATSPLDRLLPSLSSLRHGAKLKALEAEYHAMRGEAEPFVDDVEIIQKHAAVLADESTLIPMLVAMAIEALGTHTMERGLALMELTPEQLQRLDGILQDMNPPGRLKWALQGELAYWVAACETLTEGGDLGGALDREIPSVVGKVPGLRGMMASDAAFGVDQYRRLIEASDDPLEAIRIGREIEQLVESRPKYAIMSKILFPSLWRAIELELRDEMLVACARVALAAERYRIEQGRYPAALAELAPKYIEAVPIDVFDGKPLKYRVEDDNVVIYSVSDNGVDDGGDVASRQTGKMMTDVGFVLLKPEFRGRPAPETQPEEDEGAMERVRDGER